MISSPKFHCVITPKTKTRMRTTSLLGGAGDVPATAKAKATVTVT